jgi:hypothetical protein
MVSDAKDFGFDIDLDTLRASVFHKLKHLSKIGDTLGFLELEYAICDAFDARHTGNLDCYADGVKNNLQFSVKSNKLKPKKGKDFQSDYDHFLSPSRNNNQNYITPGPKIIQRRQFLDFDDIAATPNEIGKATLNGFNSNIIESYQKFNTSESIEIVVVHGYDYKHEHYLVSVFWGKLKELDEESITWIKEKGKIAGYVISSDGIRTKVCERISGNSNYQATCFIEYKDLSSYSNSVQINLPLPEMIPFDRDALLEEIRMLEESKNEFHPLFVSL